MRADSDQPYISVKGAREHNLKDIDVSIERGTLTVVTGVSGSGKSSLAFDTILAEAQRRFFYTLSHYSRQFLDLGSRPAVKSISGLSPAIALAQNETMPSRRSTVGTLSDVSELFGVLFARFGQPHCPTHGLPTSSRTVAEMVEHISDKFHGETVALCLPLAEQKKGHFAAKLRSYANKGFSRAFIDGDVVSLSPVPELVKEEKHVIKIFVDVVKVNEKNRPRLQRSLETAFEEGDGYCEAFVAKSSKSLDLETKEVLSSSGGCPTCGYSWPRLDSRYFSANSLGKCSTCQGYGVVDSFEDEEYRYEFEFEDSSQLSRLDCADLQCPDCLGVGIDTKMSAVTFFDWTVHKCQQATISELLDQLREKLKTSKSFNPACLRVLEQIQTNLQKIEEVGLGYLTLSRRIRSLSGGELQRLKLAGILGENLKGVLYVLDEPSQGLHPTEITQLCDTLNHLTSLGNTLLVVDHDETLMRRADWIIDLGPGGGEAGGQIMAAFRPKQAKQFVRQSMTAKHLAKSIDLSKSLSGKLPSSTDRITIVKPSLNNLAIESVEFQKQQLNVVTGVSGAGKSSLVLSVLYENALAFINEKKKPKKFPFRYCEKITGLESFTSAHLINRKPVAKTSVSMPATYLDIFTELRNFYGKLPDAQVAGLTAASFSLAREGGRCESCKGRGLMSLKMRFLADAKVKCHSCKGRRYLPHLLDITYHGYSLSDILNLSLEKGMEEFATFAKIQRRLQPAIDLGLGYLKLGQPSSSLSGGEAQRLKLAPFLGKKYDEGSLIILDEPTSGLHFEDVAKLMASLRKLVDQGATVILVEHSLEVIAEADWLVDLGPGAAVDGGRLLYQGVPKGLRDMGGTPTAEYLN